MKSHGAVVQDEKKRMHKLEKGKNFTLRKSNKQKKNEWSEQMKRGMSSISDVQFVVCTVSTLLSLNTLYVSSTIRPTNN